MGSGGGKRVGYWYRACGGVSLLISDLTPSSSSSGGELGGK